MQLFHFFGRNLPLLDATGKHRLDRAAEKSVQEACLFSQKRV